MSVSEGDEKAYRFSSLLLMVKRRKSADRMSPKDGGHGRHWHSELPGPKEPNVHKALAHLTAGVSTSMCPLTVGEMALCFKFW